MLKKVSVIVLLFICFVLCYFVLFDKEDTVTDTFYIEKDFESADINTLLMTDFENNSDLTVGQLLVFYSRLYGNNISSYKEAQDFAVVRNILLPSDLVYDMGEWEVLWRTTVLGNTVFEKVNDDTYAIPLIPQYLTIYLNEQGYSLIKQGLIPPQLYFYSPFSGIDDFEEINLNKKVSVGFVLEVLMSIECEGDRKEVIYSIIKERIESITGVAEEDWTSNEKALYNYYSLSYYGEFSYLKSKGYIDTIEMGNLMDFISPSDFIVLVSKILE